ncbi:MAG: hypothetical protein JWO26_3005 [Rhodospirillales bacterium]|nr:hypothetical protein [Rhodospirillales bacterium]MDB5383373.1 hypothetical protein [Rhodospirillales bacterium]
MLARAAQLGRVPALIRQNLAFVLLLAIGIAAAIATYELRGAAAFRHAMESAGETFVFILPSLVGGLLLAGALKQLVPAGALAKWMGAEAGLRGLVIATLAGMATPGGPMAAFPLVLVLAQAGADRGALVAFIFAWSLNGFQRLLIYEVPLLGTEFAMMRVLLTLPMPILAGWLSRLIPIRWQPPK